MPPASRHPERASRAWKAGPRFAEVAGALGAKVRWWRRRAGLTLEAAAERMDLDWRHLHKIEAGQLNVTLVSLVRIADGLGVPLAALFRTCPLPPRSVSPKR